MNALKALAAGLALFLTLGASAESCEKPQDTGSASSDEDGIPAGEIDTTPPEESCDKPSRKTGVRGRVIGAESVNPDGITCLEIKTSRGRVLMIRVSRNVHDRCHPDLFGPGRKKTYPSCARDS